MKPLFILLLAVAIKGCRPHSFSPYGPGFDFNLFRNTPVWDLGVAVEADDTAGVRMRVHAAKGNIDFQDPKFGNSLLTLAVVNNKGLAAKVLLDSGADPNLRSRKYDLTPFLAACRYGNMDTNNLEILSVLVKHGADVNSKQIQVYENGGVMDIATRTALEFSIKFGTLETVKLLIENGANLDIYPKDGPGSLLYMATIARRYNILRFLLIEKRIAIPDYVVIRESSKVGKEKISLRQIIVEKGVAMDPTQEKLREEILEYLSAHGK
jgi:Ankyrin repeats (3 copies)